MSSVTPLVIVLSSQTASHRLTAQKGPSSLICQAIPAVNRTNQLVPAKQTSEPATHV